VSNLVADPNEQAPTVAFAPPGPGPQLLGAREVPLGGPRAMVVRRTLPHRARRTVGAWCFADHYGPQQVGTPGMHVPPHPHTGLQTVTWLFDGEVLHQDSLGSLQRIRPGELNLMTAGRGIAHAEDSRPVASPLHGLQLWIALPDAERNRDPGFEHHADLPVLERDGVTVTVLVGALDGARSAATTFSPVLGAEVALTAGSAVRLELEPEFEHAVLTASSGVLVDGQPVPPSTLAYLGRGRREVMVGADGGPARCVLLGGTPFEEDLLMWWNFVGRDHDEIVQDRADWEAGHRFGEVAGYPDGRLAAPTLPTVRLRPRPPTPD